jgi:exonuclease SbcC
MGEAMAKGLVDRLKAYEIQEIPDDLSSLLASLRERKDAWLKQEADKRAIENVLSTIKGELQRLDGVIETEKRALQEKEDSLRVLLDAFAKAEGERMNLFGDKDADKEEDRLSSAVHSAETAEKKASKESADLLQKVRTAKDRIESFETSLGKRRPLLETKESLFLEELSSIGFTDERQFLSSTLSLSDRNRLAQEAKTLDDRQTELKANQRDRTTRLGIELGKALTENNLVELEPLFAEKEDELKVVRDTVAEHKAKLKGNVAAKQQIASKQEALEKRRKECSKWDRLHSLIGSADGKKFRNFAQGLTFELMVGHANRQLERMSDRYLLIRSAEQPLELNVIDNYQAGEIRSTKNLSGGESFIVSLTLALGLSKMASRKVRVDSLFLDEGFGTLDEASLETALKTLSSLHQDGKLIGVISHVSAMQDLISTQIVITPASGGKSLLTGPGCSRVD